MKNNILPVLLSSIFSFLVLLILFQLITPQYEKITEKIEFNIDIELDKTTPCLLECIKKYANSKPIEHQSCSESCYEENEEESWLENISLYEYFLNTEKPPDFVINLIFFLLWISLLMQSILLYISFFRSSFGVFEKYYFHIADTALNSPPILGVIGTIYSFASYTTQLNSTSDLIEGFKSSFFDAAFTTIIAGFIYVINLYFKIIILKDREK